MLLFFWPLLRKRNLVYFLSHKSDHCPEIQLLALSSSFCLISMSWCISEDVCLTHTWCRMCERPSTEGMQYRKQIIYRHVIWLHPLITIPHHKFWWLAPWVPSNSLSFFVRKQVIKKVIATFQALTKTTSKAIELIYALIVFNHRDTQVSPMLLATRALINNIKEFLVRKFFSTNKVNGVKKQNHTQNHPIYIGQRPGDWNRRITS